MHVLTLVSKQLPKITQQHTATCVHRADQSSASAHVHHKLDPPSPTHNHMQRKFAEDAQQGTLPRKLLRYAQRIMLERASCHTECPSP